METCSDSCRQRRQRDYTSQMRYSIEFWWMSVFRVSMSRDTKIRIVIAICSAKRSERARLVPDRRTADSAAETDICRDAHQDRALQLRLTVSLPRSINIGNLTRELRPRHPACIPCSSGWRIARASVHGASALLSARGTRDVNSACRGSEGREK